MDEKNNFYAFSADSIDGEQISFEKYRGKVVIVVNVASKCGFTPQYEGLQELYEKFKDKGLEILGFPCNQFRKQEPESNQIIKAFCNTTYGVSFQMFSKIDVKGENAHPLYKFLTKQKQTKDLLGEDVKWNFEKFVIDRKGNVVKRFRSMKTPKQIEKFIESLI